MADYLKDPAVVSVFWGRIGAAVLALAAFVLGIFGYTISADEQAELFNVISAVIAGLAGLLAAISKIRESKKIQ